MSVRHIKPVRYSDYVRYSESEPSVLHSKSELSLLTVHQKLFVLSVRHSMQKKLTLHNCLGISHVECGENRGEIKPVKARIRGIKAKVLNNHFLVFQQFHIRTSEVRKRRTRIAPNWRWRGNVFDSRPIKI